MVTTCSPTGPSAIRPPTTSGHLWKCGRGPGSPKRPGPSTILVQLQHPQADRVSPPPAQSLGKTSTPDTRARPVRLSGPSRGRGAQPGSPGLWNHRSPTHRAPSKSVRLNERHGATCQRHNIARTPQAHHHWAQPPGPGAIPRVPPTGTALSARRRQYDPLPKLGLKNPQAPQTRNQQPPQAPRDYKPQATQTDPRSASPPHPNADWPRDSPAQPAAPLTPINHPATGPASTPAEAHAPHADAPTRRSATGPDAQDHSRKDHHWLKLWEGHTARRPQPKRLTGDCR